MGLQKVERVRKFLVYEYDATVDGGAADTYTMRNLDELNALEEGVVILSGFIKMEDDFVDTDGMSAATIDVGDGTDPDRFFDTTNVAGLADGDTLTLESGAVLSVIGAGETAPVVTIGGGGLDAGKFKVYLEYIKPLV